MVVEEVHFYIITFLSLFFALLLLRYSLDANDPGLQPPSNRMIRIDSVIELYLFALLPLLEYAGGLDGDGLIILGRPPRIVHVDGAMANEQHLSIDPLANRVLDV